jgi:hypothetical protein
MTTPKRRKPLGDSLASEFVYGSPAPQPPAKEPTPEPVTAPPEKPASKAATKNTPRPTEDDILSRVLTPTEDRERMIRFTADLPESLHRKLTMLAAKSGKKKVEIVRAILEEVLKDVDE